MSHKTKRREASRDGNPSNEEETRVMRKADRLRNQESPTVLGVELYRESLTPVKYATVRHDGDYGADPVGDGTFKMVPSGDIVDFEERCRRMALIPALRRLPDQYR